MAKKDLQIKGFSGMKCFSRWAPSLASSVSHSARATTVTTFAATSATVEVYKLKRIGSFVGEELNPDAWTLIGRVTLDTFENRPTAIPPGTIDPVIIEQATTQAFYVTFQADSNYNRYSRASKFGDVAAQNDDIQFKVVSSLVFDGESLSLSSDDKGQHWSTGLHCELAILIPSQSTKDFQW